MDPVLINVLTCLLAATDAGMPRVWQRPTVMRLCRTVLLRAKWLLRLSIWPPEGSYPMPCWWQLLPMKAACRLVLWASDVGAEDLTLRTVSSTLGTAAVCCLIPVCWSIYCLLYTVLRNVWKSSSVWCKWMRWLWCNLISVTLLYTLHDVTFMFCLKRELFDECTCWSWHGYISLFCFECLSWKGWLHTVLGKYL